jgi:phosphoglycerate kinase
MTDKISPGLVGIKTIEELDIREKRVFIRLDLNVPMSKGRISDDTRIRAAIPTIKYAIERKAKIVMASHLGRPKGLATDREKYSLDPVADRLTELLRLEVVLFDDPRPSSFA